MRLLLFRARRHSNDGPRTLVGVGGFKGAPDASGVVDVGYGAPESTGFAFVGQGDDLHAPPDEVVVRYDIRRPRRR